MKQVLTRGAAPSFESFSFPVVRFLFATWLWYCWCQALLSRNFSTGGVVFSLFGKVNSCFSDSRAMATMYTRKRCCGRPLSSAFIKSHETW